MKTKTPGPTLLFRLLLLLICLGLTSAGPCRSYRDCKRCTGSSRRSRCSWCPLDNTCHGHGSWYNRCTSRQTVYSPDKCFDTDRGTYDPREAYVNTLLSAAAYVNRPQMCARRFSLTADYEVKQLIGHACHDMPIFKYTKCFAYTAVSTRRSNIVVVFRGTAKTTQLVNEFISVLTKPKVRFMIGGHVQHYFANAFNKLSPAVEASVRKLMRRYPNFKVTITGHSLGGALASLTAASLVYKNIVPADKLTLYSFGQPRVGDRYFAYKHDKLIRSSWRVVHYLDIVTNIPTCTPVVGCSRQSWYAPYHHGDEIFYPAERMRVSSRYIQCKGDESMSCSNGYIARCTYRMKQCINDHYFYFGVRVGSACARSSSSQRVGQHGAEISDDDADLERRLFANDVCNVIDLSGED